MKIAYVIEATNYVHWRHRTNTSNSIGMEYLNTASPPPPPGEVPVHTVQMTGWPGALFCPICLEPPRLLDMLK